MTKEQHAIEMLARELVSRGCPRGSRDLCKKTKGYGDAECQRCWKRWAGLDVETAPVVTAEASEAGE